MNIRPVILGMSLALALSACERKAADGAGVAQGSAPEGTISDELPDLDLLPNDAPLADPADVPPVPGLPGDPALTLPDSPPSSDAADAAPAPAPAEPAVEGSIAE